MAASSLSPELEDLKRRLYSRVAVEVNGNCILWMGHRLPWGYGNIVFGKKILITSRVAWMLVNGPIPEGMNVLHACDNPPCINVEHLFLGTHQDNMRDRDAKGRKAVGARNGLSKLNESDIGTIRELQFWLSHREIGRLYGRHHATIGAVLRGVTWKHVA